MRKSLCTGFIAVLSLGLLALFLRGAHLDVVWTEIKRADPWMIALSAAVTVVTMVLRALRWQYLLEPIGHARFSSAFRTTTIGFAASAVLPARAPGGDSSLLAGTAGGVERDRDVRDDHHRAAARCGDLRRVARVLRVVFRSGHGPGGQPVVTAWSKSEA